MKKNLSAWLLSYAVRYAWIACSLSPIFSSDAAAVSLMETLQSSTLQKSSLLKPSLQKTYDSSITNPTVSDQLFLALRDAARKDDDDQTRALAYQLRDYPVPSYVDYFRLKTHLKVASQTEIRNFLALYNGSAIADRLRNDWLLALGHRADFVTFDEQYPLFVLNDDTQLKCYALISKLRKQENVASAARNLLTSPKDYGDGCIELIDQLQQTGQFSSEDVWAQARLAAEKGYTDIARRILSLTDLPFQYVSYAFNQPARLLNSFLVEPTHSKKRRGKNEPRALHLEKNTRAQFFIFALARLAKIDLDQAVSMLRQFSAHLTRQEEELAWAQIALPASLKLNPNALQYWVKAGNAPLSPEAMQWRVRVALRMGDWQQVQAGIDAMPALMRAEPCWIYWRGRALQALGQNAAAQALFQSIADQYHFYGQLALEETGKKITVPKRAAPPTAQELQQAANNAGLLRALYFFALDLRFEAIREWNWELRKMNDRQLLAAAEFARQQNVLDRMVNTSNRTRTEMDFLQRFPAPFHDIVQAKASPLNLDIAWAYGLIRQESRFIMNAKSSSGASGLMQLMPATAHYVARKIGLGDYSHAAINEIDTNILLGVSYLNLVLNKLDGSQTLASAAYNAGPSRSFNWRASLDRPVEGAVFAESIPFDETRDYVKNVLSNATYYAVLFEGQPQSLKARLGVVVPRAYAVEMGEIE